MAKTIAFANQKGGVAKTTSTFNVGCALAGKGKKVLMADLDPQASLTICSGLEPEDCTKTIAEVLMPGNVTVRDCIQHIRDGLDLIPSCPALVSVELTLTGRMARESVLKGALAAVRDNYDYILLDCPPDPGLLTVNALVASDAVIIPVAAEYLAYRGAEQMTDNIADIKQLINPNLQLLGVLVCRFKGRQNEDREVLQLLQENYNVIGVIKDAVAAKKGVADGLCAAEVDKKSQPASEYDRLAEMLIGGK